MLALSRGKKYLCSPLVNPIQRTSPRVIPNLKIWLDGAAYNTFSFSTGSDVSAWADKSGNSNNAVQASAGDQPLYVSAGINSLPAVQFYDDSDAKLLSIPDHASLDYTAFSAYVVFRRATDLNANERIFGKFSVASPANTREFSFLVIGSGTDVFQIATSSAGNAADGLGGTTKTIAAGTTGYIGHGRFAAASGVVRVNNESSTQASGSIPGLYAGTSPVHIGARDGAAEPFAGYIGEILFYTRQLTDAENDAVLLYLSRKWKIAVN